MKFTATAAPGRRRGAVPRAAALTHGEADPPRPSPPSARRGDMPGPAPYPVLGLQLGQALLPERRQLLVRHG